MKLLESQIKILYGLLRHEGSWTQLHCQDVINGQLIERGLVYGIDAVFKFCHINNGRGNCFIGRNPRTKSGSIERITSFTADIDRLSKHSSDFVSDTGKVRKLNRETYNGHLASSGTGYLVVYPFAKDYSPGEVSGKAVEVSLRDSISRAGYNFKVDSTHDDARLVKLIGTMSCKLPNRQTLFLDIGKDRHFDKLIDILIPPGQDRIERNEKGWVAKALEELGPGNLHMNTVKIIGKLHRNKWSKEDIRSLLTPHIKGVGGNLTAFEQRLDSVTNYPVAEQIIREASTKLPESDDAQNLAQFLAAGDIKTKWFIKDLIAEETLTLIAGLGETRKSWMLMDLALECAKGGGYWVGKFPIKDGKVLYIDQERSKSETRRRFQRLINAKNLNAKQLRENLIIMCGTSIRLNIDTSYKALRHRLEKDRPSVILVDSFITFHTKEENSRSELQIVFERLKEIRRDFGCSIILLDHESKMVLSQEAKEREPNAHDTIGSAGKIAAVETVLTVRKKDAESSEVYHTKSTCGRTLPPFIVKVEDLQEGQTSVKAY